jgi:hypothetical protein
MGTAIAIVLSYVVRVAFVAGVMLLVGFVVSTVMGWFNSLLGIQSGAAVLMGFLLVAIAGIAGGTYVSMRFVFPNAILHPVVAAALLGLFPAGVTFQGDAGLMRFAIVMSTIAIATIAAVVIRFRAKPNYSPELMRDR